MTRPVRERGPALLWLFVTQATQDVLALNANYREIRISMPLGESRIAVSARSLKQNALLIGEKSGAYQGPIGGRVLVSRTSGLSRDELQNRLRRKHPKWSTTKIERALRNIAETEQYNLLPDHLKYEYKQFWAFIGDLVRLCGEAVFIYDDGTESSAKEHFETKEGLGRLLKQAEDVNIKATDETVLYKIAAHKAYRFL